MGGRGSKSKNTVTFIPHTSKTKSSKKPITILLQGSGESGKSTVLKQFRLIHGKGFSKAYKKDKKNIILHNLVNYANNALIEIQKQGKHVDAANEQAAELVRKACPTKTSLLNGDEAQVEMTPQLAQALATLATDAEFQRCVEGYGSSVVQDGLLKLLAKFAKVPGWGVGTWVPSEEDLLLARVRTGGADIKNSFMYDGYKFNIIDVGGQQQERHRYNFLFKKATVVLYIASLSEYDQRMYENADKYRLEDSLDLFRQVANAKELKNTSLIVFFNKQDLFEKKYLHNGINFPLIESLPLPPPSRKDSNGQIKDDAVQLEEAKEWFRELYSSQLPEHRSGVGVTEFYDTVATDSSIMTDVVNAISVDIIKKALKSVLISP